jgi:CheY-like chemotaxis protein
MRVLLVEDDRDTLASLAAVLRFERYDVLTAPDGPVALEIAKLQPPDVVLLDIGLPGIDGYQVARELRQQVTGRALYIAAVTGHSTDADRQRAFQAGIDAHLAKPARPAAVLELLEEFESRMRKA